MKIISLFFLLNVSMVFAQQPLTTMWDRNFGAIQGDGLYTFQQTSDTGFILGGCSWSGVSGDKTEPLVGGVGLDYWIIKTDSSGILVWEEAYGGTGYDWFSMIQQTTDGGYILGGFSNSEIGGDKTEPNMDPTLFPATYDYWIIKVDALGNRQWDKTYGGIEYDFLQSVCQTSDGGYILGGYSDSDIGGNKTTSLISPGYSDFWIIKIDSLGNKQWEKDFGGPEEDRLYSIRPCTGGYIMGGGSTSNIGGDRTAPVYGYEDYWIIKTDSFGNKLWDQSYGGTGNQRLFSLQETFDKGFFLGGFSNSSISGNKTQGCFGGLDYWVIKTDSAGNMQWDKVFGGASQEDQFDNVWQTTDSGYVIAGRSRSNISGNKTQNNLDPDQTWVVKMDSSGNKIWDRTLLINAKVEFGWVAQTFDGCYAVANFNTGTVGGDKTQNTWGENDYWIIKLCETLSANLSSPNILCEGECINFTNLSTNATTYQWSFPGGTPDTSTLATPPSICYPATGTYDVVLIAGNQTQMDTLTLSNYITVSNAPLISINQSNDTLFATPLPGSYQWYYNGNVIPGATQNFYVANQSGTFSVSVTNLSGCNSSAIIQNLPVAAFNSPDHICEGSCIDFTNLASNGATFQWYFPGAVPSTSTDENPTNICYSTTGSFDVTLIATNTNGVDTLILSNYLTVNTPPPPPMVFQSFDTLYTDSLFSTYQWSESGNIIPGATDYFYVTAFTGVYEVLVTDSNGCTTSASFPNLPAISFITNNNVCPGGCIDFYNNTTSATSYQWLFTGASPNSSTDVNPANICYANEGSYDVTLIASNANGSDTLTLSSYITVFPQPSAQSITQSGDTLFAITGSSSYQWYFNGNIIPGAINSFYVAIQNGDYNVIATDSNGCEVEAVINDVLTHTPIAFGYLPFAIYPNPVTSTIDIRGLENNSADEIKIFNAYGEKVFAVDWKLGTVRQSGSVLRRINCELLPAGVYYLEITSDKKIYRTKFIKQ